MKNFRIDTLAGRNKLPPRQAPYFIKLDKGQSLGYRQGKTGGSWLARLINADDKTLYFKIVVNVNDPQKEYGEAVKQAQEWFSLQEKGVKTDYLLKDAIDDYLNYLQKEKSAAVHKTAAGVLKGIPERLQKIPVHELTTRQLDKWRVSFLSESKDAELVRRSQNTSNRRWSDLRACLNRAFQQGYVVDKTAWDRIQPYKKAQKGRQIFWTPREANNLLTAAKALNRDFYRLIKAGLLTGCRIGELTSLKVKDFDKANELLSIKASKTGHREVFLSTPAVTFFKAMAKDKHPAAWLLDYKGREWPEDYHHKLFRRCRKNAEIDPDSTFYCARHYHISQGLQAGISVDLIAKNCGTSPAMIHQFYGKFTRTAQKEAAAKLGNAMGIE
jgi:integrase